MSPGRRTHSTRHAAIATYVGVVILGTLLCARPATGGESSVLPINQSGIAPSRGYVSLLPWEQIDMFSGNVVLTFEDLVLPGYGGLDLRIQRTFNSNSMDWRFSLGYPETIYDEGPNTRFPVVSSGDGSEHATFLTSGDWAAGVFTTSQVPGVTRGRRGALRCRMATCVSIRRPSRTWPFTNLSALPIRLGTPSRSSIGPMDA